MKIRHTGLAVFDIERSIKFYRDVLGLKVIEKKTLEGDYIQSLLNWKDAKLTYVKLKTPGSKTLIELWQFRIPIDITPAFSHVAFTVANVDKLYKKLKEKKINFLSEPVESPDKKVKICFCKDYDGNLIELVEEIKD